ncbi:MAG: response regulator, partial [Candidatus Sericytochromatia bacterium]|nr:response regulator [Candidatus Sericytochromatia bacterium]
KVFLEALPEVRGQGFEALIDQVMATGEPFIVNELPGKVDRSGTGHIEDIVLNLNYIALRDADGTATGLFICADDVTDQVYARRRVESLMDELKLADQRKDEFLATLAHELRNPMASITMALSLLEGLPNDAGKAAKYRETVRRQMGTLVRLVDDMLDVSRITTGRVELRMAASDLAIIVQNAVTDTRTIIEAHGHELSVTVVAGAYGVHADATRLELVVVNLLTNAAKYTEPGGRLSVHLARDVADGAAQAVLRVADTGRGIPPDMLETVFDLFVQVSPSLDRNTGGLGLGLTLVKRLVDMHGGSVSAHSGGTGRGSEFVVRLPLIEVDQAQAVPVFVVRTPQHADSHSGRRVLIVEDSVDARETLRACLEDFGHDVVAATNGLEGLALLLSLRPDVALVDVGLPGIDGYEVARRVRAAPGGDALYLVALTGYGGMGDKAEAYAAGFDLHITKPIDTAELRRLVSAAKPDAQ